MLVRHMMLILFKMTSGTADGYLVSGVLYEEFYKINDHESFLSVCVTVFRDNEY